MNNNRRKYLRVAHEHLEKAKEIIETAQSEEQDSFDNLPENMQGGDQGQKLEENVDAMQTAVDACEEALSSLEVLVV